jgi:aldehyde:ferredoxin oxidoreductase
LIEAGFLCEDLGLDPVSMGASISFLMECYQRKLYDDDVLDWGNDELVLDLIRQTASRKGTGEMLALGVRGMSRKIDGSRDFALEVKGLEISAIDARAAKAHALAMAVCNRGGDTGMHMPQFELLDKTEAEAENEFIFASSANPQAWQGKSNMVIWHEYFGAVLDSATICKHYAFTTYAVKPGDVAEMLTFATGIKYNEMEIMFIGERISTIERLFDLRHGLNPRLDDTLPNRMLRERLTDGKAAGQPVELGKMLEEYYMLRGFTSDGMPRMDNLQSLGIVSEKTAKR